MQIGLWKTKATQRLSSRFSNGFTGTEVEQQALHATLYRKMGEVEVENDWLKKKLGLYALRRDGGGARPQRGHEA